MMDRPSLRGAMTAMVTPFSRGEIDWPRLAENIEFQIGSGTDWLVPCGTTGESTSLSDLEHDQLLEFVLNRTSGRRPILAGTGTNSTAQTITRTRRAAEAGASAALVVTPYYVRPTQEGLFRHYAAVADSSFVPIVLYNVPIRTGVDLHADTIARLHQAFPHIAAVKHATGSVDGVTDLVHRCGVSVFSGDDALTWPMMSLGAVGVISVLGNLRPALMKRLSDCALQGDSLNANKWHREVHALASGIGRFGPNPLPIKTAMAICGMIEEEFRLPMCPLGAEARAGVDRTIRSFGLVGATAA